MINIVCEDIEKAIEAGAFISALSLALNLPDWCGKAEYPSENTASRYKKWYAEYVGKYETYDGNKHPYLSADVVYSLRNHLLHQGALTYDNKDIHQEQNKVGLFSLYFNSDTGEGGESFLFKGWGEDSTQFKSYRVNALNLVMKLQLCAAAYYKENKEKFEFLKIKIMNK